MIFKNIIDKFRLKDEFTNPITGRSNLNFEPIIISVIIIMVSFGSFGLGRLSRSMENNTPLIIDNMEARVVSVKSDAKSSSDRIKTPSQFPQGDGVASTAPGGFIVASKSGKKYHFPWCGSASQIKDENKVWFSSEEEARSAGYVPASNCKGLTK